MKNALLLHGTYGDHTSNWCPWLGKELTRKGYHVWVPDLPGSDKPNIRRYNDFLFSRWTFDANSIIVGHSSGAVAALGILQELPKDIVIKKAILVAGFTDDLEWEPLGELFTVPFEWEKIRNHAEEIILIHSDNDPYVEVRHGEILKKKLHAKLHILRGQGHFNTEQDPKFTQFPELLEMILA